MRTKAEIKHSFPRQRYAIDFPLCFFVYNCSGSSDVLTNHNSPLQNRHEVCFATGGSYGRLEF
jgi:hypothetical protein